MKKLKTFIASLLIAAVSPVFIGTETHVNAATKEDVIAAARSVGLYDNYIQIAINHLETTSYTSEQYDQMVAIIYANGASLNDMIKDYLGEQEVPAPEQPSQPPEDEPSVPTPTSPQEPTDDPVPEKTPDAPGTPDVSDEKTSETPAKEQNDDKPAEEKKVLFSELTPEQQEEYINSLTTSQKKEIIKNLDRDKQLEVINGLINSSSGLGLNITVDSFTDGKLEYSVRNDSGDIVDISSMGVMVDDTGIDYTFLILSSAAVILISAGGLATMSAWNKKEGKK